MAYRSLCSLVVYSGKLLEAMMTVCGLFSLLLILNQLFHIHLSPACPFLRLRPLQPQTLLSGMKHLEHCVKSIQEEGKIRVTTKSIPTSSKPLYNKPSMKYISARNVSNFGSWHEIALTTYPYLCTAAAHHGILVPPT